MNDWKEALQKELEIDDLEAEKRELEEEAELIAEGVRTLIRKEGSVLFTQPIELEIDKTVEPITLLWMFMYDSATPKLRR